MKKHLSLLFAFFILAAFFSGCARDSSEPSVLIVAIPASPACLDSDLITTQNVNDVMSHVYEGLFEFNAQYEATPHLAESYEVLDGGRTYSITLRKGVKFHDGSEMTSADVIASFERWLSMNAAGKNLAPFLDNYAAASDYLVNITFTEPYAPFLQTISANVANQKLVIRPKSLCEAYPDSELGKHIGTGPYTFVEFLPNQHILLNKYGDYTPNNNSPSGMTGKRTAETDQLKYVIVPEQAVRIAGVQSGEYHFAMEIPSDQYTQLSKDDRVQTFIISPNNQLLLIINQGGKNLYDIKARQAVSVGLDMEELAGIAIGNKDFWNLNPSLFAQGTPWYDPNAGAGIYNTANLERAKQLLSESSYDGSPVVILNQRENLVYAQTAIALKTQLEAIGFNVDLQLLDEATVVEKRGQKDAWDIHVNVFRAPDPDPQVYGAWMGTNKWIGNWDDEYSVKMDEIFNRMIKEVDQAARYEIVREWYAYFYETVPYVKVVDYNGLIIASPLATGYAAYTTPFFWNVSLDS